MQILFKNWKTLIFILFTTIYFNKLTDLQASYNKKNNPIIGYSVGLNISSQSTKSIVNAHISNNFGAGISLNFNGNLFTNYDFLGYGAEFNFFIPNKNFEKQLSRKIYSNFLSIRIGLIDNNTSFSLVYSLNSSKWNFITIKENLLDVESFNRYGSSIGCELSFLLKDNLCIGAVYRYENYPRTKKYPKFNSQNYLVKLIIPIKI